MRSFGLSAAVALALMLACPGSFATGNAAKDLYMQQLNKPTEKLNTGLSYWIELHRAGAVKRVNSTTTFKSGDQIRIHVTPNIDGYAYIVMLQGSTGKQAVLFPATDNSGGNRVIHGKSYLLPMSGAMVFDDHPGKETIRLVLSRLPVSAQSLLPRRESNPKPQSNSQQIAANLDSQAPVQISGETPPSSDAPAPNYVVSVDDPNKPLDQELEQISQKEQDLGLAKDLYYQPPTASAHSSGQKHTTGAKRVVAHHPVHLPASITVVCTLPSSQLFADIVLHHK